MTTIDELRQLPDHQLLKLGGAAAEQVLDARADAARHLRLTMARVMGCDVPPDKGWHMLPCLTAHDTVGVLNIAHGVAWDTGEPAAAGVHDLGLSEAVYAAANSPGQQNGAVRIGQEIVQQDGAAVVDDRPVPPTMPDGWRQIALPTWRSWHPTPPAQFTPDRWIRPTLVAAGLMTCYGWPGTADGSSYQPTSGWEAQWPHGLPPWVDGQSVTVLDVLADAYPSSALRRTRLPRGSDEEELARIGPLVHRIRDWCADTLRSDTVAKASQGHARTLAAGADALRQHQPPDKALRNLVRDLFNRAPADDTLRMLHQRLLALPDAMDALHRGSPWEAARALAEGVTYQLVHDLWPGSGPVGAVELAAMAGVDRDTVDAWRRHVPDFPAPGSSGTWDRGEITQWLVDTGRL